MPTLTAQCDSGSGRVQVIRELRAELKTIQRDLRPESRQQKAVSTGIPAVDDLLPDQGLLRGGLSEWIATEPGSGAGFLAMKAAGQAQQAGPVLIVDALRQCYAPSFAAAGVCPQRTILIHPGSRTEELWSIEQALRCSGIGAVLCRIDHLKPQECRRLQLAAEAGTAVGILIRSAAAQRQSGWSDVRLQITPQRSGSSFCRRLTVQCVYARGSLAGRSVPLEICDETGAVCVAAGFSSAKAAAGIGHQSDGSGSA